MRISSRSGKSIGVDVAVAVAGAAAGVAKKGNDCQNLHSDRIAVTRVVGRWLGGVGDVPRKTGRGPTTQSQARAPAIG